MAVKFLSAEWVAAVEHAMNSSVDFTNAAAGNNARLQQVVTDSPEGEDTRYYFVLEEGSAQLGLGELVDPDATITQSYSTAVAINERELPIIGAFMQGQLKVTGNTMKLLQLGGVVGAMVQAISSVDVHYEPS